MFLPKKIILQIITVVKCSFYAGVIPTMQLLYAHHPYIILQERLETIVQLVASAYFIEKKKLGIFFLKINVTTVRQSEISLFKTNIVYSTLQL